MTTPLSLYVHIPWCVRKCPYCDFNSHELKGDIPAGVYVNALLDDLRADVAAFDLNAEVASIFIGGGTPSLMPGRAVADLIVGIGEQLVLASDVEITLEANPGTIKDDAAKFGAFRDAGVNRLSIGVQSFDDASLRALGRIHTNREAAVAFRAARRAGFDNINIDLMHGLPGQSAGAAMADLEAAIGLAPEHISWYQLTIEPNTIFYKRPPVLPDEDILWEISEAGLALLARRGYARYEVSAFASQGSACRHNLGYWQFGDYLGIGAGAHGKLTLAEKRVRTVKTRLPRDYLSDPGRRDAAIERAELPIEFLMNALRLVQGFTRDLFCERTGLGDELLDQLLGRAATRGLVTVSGDRVKPTPLGLQYLDDLLVMTMDNDIIASAGRP